MHGEAVLERLRKVELDAVQDRATMRAHIDSCFAANTQAAKFRMELRGYCVAILVAVIGLIAAAKFHLV